MSHICIGTALINVEEKLYFMNRLKQTALSYNRGVFFGFDWEEPILHELPSNVLRFSLSDDDRWDNCEMLLMPQNMQNIDAADKQAFSTRMQYIYDIADIFVNTGKQIEFYIGLSGMLLEEYKTQKVCLKEIKDVLCKTVGIVGGDCGIHIIVVSL